MRRTLLALSAVAVSAFGQEQLYVERPVYVEPPVYVTAIEVVADVRDVSGKLPRNLTPADFILLEEGLEQRIIAVDYLRLEPPSDSAATTPEGTPAVKPPTPAEWQIVIYFETVLSNGKSRQRAAEAILAHVDRLVQIGAVDVVIAAPAPVALVRNSRDPEAIRQALRRIAQYPGINQLAAHRRQFYREAQGLSGLQAVRDASREPFVESGRTPQGAPITDISFGEAPATFEAAVVRPYINAEMQMISQFHIGLVTWLKSYRRHIPRTLLMVTDGFDANPIDFYIANLSKGDQIKLRASVTETRLSELTQELADALAFGAWSTVSIPTDDTDGWVDDSSFEAMGRAHGMARKPMNPRGFFFSPLEPLNEIAAATGGKVVKSSGRVGDVIAEIDDRIKITYQVNRRPDGKARPITLRMRDRSLSVRSARWALSSTPEEIAENRALRLLREASFDGDLPVESSVEWKDHPGRRSGMLRATAKLDLITSVLPAGARGAFRFTLAIQLPPNRAAVVNRVVSDYDISAGTFLVRTPIDMPATASGMVIVIEEIATGLWGSARVEIR